MACDVLDILSVLLSLPFTIGPLSRHNTNKRPSLPSRSALLVSHSPEHCRVAGRRMTCPMTILSRPGVALLVIACLLGGTAAFVHRNLFHIWTPRECAITVANTGYLVGRGYLDSFRSPGLFPGSLSPAQAGTAPSPYSPPSPVATAATPARVNSVEGLVDDAHGDHIHKDIEKAFGYLTEIVGAAEPARVDLDYLQEVAKLVGLYLEDREARKHADPSMPLPAPPSVATAVSLQDSSEAAISAGPEDLKQESPDFTSKAGISFESRLGGALKELNAEQQEIENAIADKHEDSVKGDHMPALSKQGMYQIESREQHAALLEANPDKLVVIKFKANYCRACKAIEPKFLAVRNDKKLVNMPIVWAEFISSQKTKNFFRRLGVLSLPTVHFYDGSNGLVENFSCGPAKIAVLRRKLVQFINSRVDPKTLQLKEWRKDGGEASGPRVVREVLIQNELVTSEHLDFLRDGMPFFADLTEEEFATLLGKARLLTFDPGDVIIRQGMPGKTFFVIKSGVAEMCIRSRFEDPISTPPSYLGAVVKEMSKFDYFGERALSTGEPLSASVRAVEKTRCFAFNVDDIPESSILSKKRRATRAMVEQLTARYQLPEDYQPTYPVSEKDESLLELLVRFKQIRQAAKCFEYVMSTEPLLGDKGEIARRSVLVSKLSKSQQQDFVEVFNMADVNRTGTISVLEMRRFMESAGKEQTDTELLDMINKANPHFDGSRSGTGITLDEFMGVMAEAYFYDLFLETFQELDKDRTGYVRAGDLDQVLHGVRDLINNNRKSIIDVEDQDVLVDYEQFAKMLLGAAL